MDADGQQKRIVREQVTAKTVTLDQRRQVGGVQQERCGLEYGPLRHAYTIREGEDVEERPLMDWLRPNRYFLNQCNTVPCSSTTESSSLTAEWRGRWYRRPQTSPALAHVAKHGLSLHQYRPIRRRLSGIYERASKRRPSCT